MPPQQPPRRGSEREDEDKDEDHGEQDAEEEEEEGEDTEEGDEGDGDEDTFLCRICKKTVDVGDGEETFALCDRCARDYDIDKMWDDLDDEVISEHQAKTISLDRYRKRKGPPKQQKGGQYHGPPRR